MPKKRLRQLIIIFLAAALAIVINYYGVNYALIAVNWLDIYIFSYLTMSILMRFLILIIWITIFLRSDNPQTKMAWLLFLLVEPVFATILFFTFGRDYRNTRRYLKKTKMHGRNYMVNVPKTDFSESVYDNIDNDVVEIFRASHGMTGHHIYANNTNIQVLKNGDQKFPKLISELKEAKKYIYMNYFIIKTDNIGKEVLEVLREKAKQGLDVKLSYDFMGCISIDKKYIKGLKKDGVKVTAIDSFRLGILSSKINFRNHRKITIIDGKVGFIGGINLGDEYNHQSKKFGFWRDTHLFVEGKLVNSLLTIFAKDWYYSTGEFLDNKRLYCAEEVKSDLYCQVIESGPDTQLPYIRNTYIQMISSAKKHVKLTSPYLILDNEFRTALIMAQLRGVKVQILIPGLPDKKAVYKITESNSYRLSKFGVEVYRYNNTFVHTKTIVVDDKIASCGTFNLDIRSFDINNEATVIMTGDVALTLGKYFDEDISSKHSNKITREEWEKRSTKDKIIEGFFDLFSPLM